MFRKATLQDLDRIAALYEAAHDEDEAGRTKVGWRRGTYPVRETAESSILRGDMFVLEEGGVVLGTGIINAVQLEQYRRCEWHYPAEDAQVCVLHTLVIDPKEKGRGYGKAFVRFYESYARSIGCTVLRIDTQEQNTIARSLYRGLGFREAGIVPGVFFGIGGVSLVCLEKAL